MKPIKFVVILSTLGMLAACGHSPGERALTGAGIGAGAGAVGGALMGNPLAGAAIGGAAGAATGAFTRPDQINLDR
ncbi:MAG: YMGG-like glycine zipper-containing protein [Alphaproteobacteria bacterium]